MSAILSSLSVEVLHLVVDCNTSYNICTTLETTLTFLSNSRIMQLYGSFQVLRQNDDSVSVYLQKAKALFDELDTVGRAIFMEKFNLYVFQGLRSNFKDHVTSLSTKANPILYINFYSSLLTHEFLHKASLQLVVIAPLLPTPTQQPSMFFVQYHFGFSTSRRGWFCKGWRHNNRSNYYRGNHGNGSAQNFSTHSNVSGQQFRQQEIYFSSSSPPRTTGNFGQQGNLFSCYNRTVKLCYKYRHTA